MNSNPDSDEREVVVASSVPVPRRRKYPLGARLVVGSIVSFLVASLLYGPTLVVQLIFFATICTVGIGLLLILAGCWLVGWVLLEMWSAITGTEAEPATS